MNTLFWTNFEIEIMEVEINEVLLYVPFDLPYHLWKKKEAWSIFIMNVKTNIRKATAPWLY